MQRTILSIAILLSIDILPCIAENAPKHTCETVRIGDGIAAFIASESNTDIDFNRHQIS